MEQGRLVFPLLNSKILLSYVLHASMCYTISDNASSSTSYASSSSYGIISTNVKKIFLRVMIWIA